MPDLTALRDTIRRLRLADDEQVLASLISSAPVLPSQRSRIERNAVELVENIRQSGQIGLMEIFLAEYGLSSEEGIALMCLAEALLRVPDEDTIDALIDDKISPSSWGEHLGKSSSSLVNASTWALMLTGKVLNDDATTGVAATLHALVKRVGEPVIRAAVKRAMLELGKQFVLGESISEAIQRGASQHQAGYRFSYDMLGEAALTQSDADAFFHAYSQAIGALAQVSHSSDMRENPGISIKLSALHPRYEVAQKERVMVELVDRAKSLALQAKAANMGLNIDAEESDRLDLSLDIIEALLGDQELAAWEGFGVVVQAYGKRCGPLIDWLGAQSEKRNRKIMVRLVKGAYWDSEIKHAQIEGLSGFPVFSNKAATDVSYICCAKKLLTMSDRIFPQFATHNAHTVCAILELADDKQSFEFQRLHGMGDVLHEQVRAIYNTHCRIYAPVGPHRDLLAYLVRRLLENGANSSFVNQLVDDSVSVSEIVTDPFAALNPIFKEPIQTNTTPFIRLPQQLYMPERKNSRGWDLNDQLDLAEMALAVAPYVSKRWAVEPIIEGALAESVEQTRFNPANPVDEIATVIVATAVDCETALSKAKPWTASSVTERKRILHHAADLFEQHYGEFFSVLCREAGKTRDDAIAELREAVDFLRYYGVQAEQGVDRKARGIIACISPWNFPLAIFTGQLAAALAAGNGVIAKPAESTSATASVAVRLLHQAGVPTSVLQFLPGSGSVIGAKLSSDQRIDGLCFTGSVATAQAINRAMAGSCDPHALLIAETGGLNAMIVDSTALPEQAVRDTVVSAFRSAGQRCSALRLLCIQEDVADDFIAMLLGAMEELVVGNPQDLSSDLGPIISMAAKQEIDDYINLAKQRGTLIKQLEVSQGGFYVGPSLIRLRSVAELKREVFGPVLHVLTFKSNELHSLLEAINFSGFGLTFGLHTRIDDRVELVMQSVKVGNLYINRNQIGAIVGSQPFGGEGLSGTGPKAGGPHYLPRFLCNDEIRHKIVPGELALAEKVQQMLDTLADAPLNRLHSIELPGPTGESNQLSLYPRGVILCLGPSAADAQMQSQIALSQGCPSIAIAPGASGEYAIDALLRRSDLTTLKGFHAVALWSDEVDLRASRIALAQRPDELIPLITHQDMQNRCIIERHVCIDTTAAGGNATLLAAGG